MDRLAELQSNFAKVPKGQVRIEIKEIKNEKTPLLRNHSVSIYERDFEPISNWIKAINVNSEKLDALKGKFLRGIVNPKEKQAAIDYVNRLGKDNTRLATSVKNALQGRKDELEESRPTFPVGSARLEIQENTYRRFLRSFHNAMKLSDELISTINATIKSGQRRQLVDLGVEEDKVDEIVESGHTNEILAQMTFDSVDVSEALQQRHNDILTLEQSVLQVYQMFNDLANLVEMQQDHLDVIESRVLKAKDYTEEAEDQLVQAEKYSNKYRKGTACLCCIVVCAAAGIIIPLWNSVFG